ncbi:uncharacterized protein [Lepeophtheirus salmonis]|uniref:uncharacterized protein n=1 Tax=Lepeophtheirus salmonis TaxID=72036 RepID=UPI001AE11B95|nr:T-complex protein 1 subunit epsilon-like [Lepeophtheirus salmonis]
MKILYDELGSTLTIPKTHNPTPLSINSIFDIAEMLSTSLGPSGLDKIIQTKDSEIIVTNDGATILENLDSNAIFVTMDDNSPTIKASVNAVYKIILGLSKAQDDNIGDGTTSIVIIAAELLKRLFLLVEKGFNIMMIIRNLGKVISEIEAFLLDNYNEANFEKDAIFAAKNALYSKIVSFKRPSVLEETKKSFSIFRRSEETLESRNDISKICLDAINYSRRGNFLNLNNIKIISKPGASISKSIFIEGILINKSLAHPQMKKQSNGKIGLLAAPLELPKTKTKANFSIKTAEEFENYENYEKKYFARIIQTLKEKEINILLCQFGFEDELTSMLTENGILGVRWVGGTEMENTALLLGASIASQVDNIEGFPGEIKELNFGTEGEKMIEVTSGNKSEICTILVRGSTEMTIKESERSIHDALCGIRNLLTDNRIVYGGGAIENDIYNFLIKKSLSYPDHSETFVAFARAIQEIPRILLRNQGLNLNILQKLGNNVGITGDMKELGVFETVKSKLSQIRMAKEVACRLLKIDEMIFTD